MVRSLALLLLFFSFLSLQAGQEYWKAEEYHQHSSSQKDAASDLMKFVPLRGDEAILDVGSGDGKITAEIAAQIPHGSITGVDISPAMVGFAQNHFPTDQYPNLLFLLKDAQALDFTGNFDIVFSFTTLQWVQKQEEFLRGAYQCLKSSGILAVTMPLGLPAALERAVKQLVSSLEWSPYFKDFSTGWNFVEKNSYEKMLKAHQFALIRCAVVEQQDVFPAREAFQKFISQWFPYLRPLPEPLKQAFLTQTIDRFLELEPPMANGAILFRIKRLEVVASKKRGSFDGCAL